VQAEQVQELQCCEAAEMQEDLRLVRAPAALGAAGPCAAQSRLQRPQRQEEMQDQDEEMQDEKAIDQVREEMQEGQKEAEVPEDMLRARLPRLNRPLTSAPSSRSRVRGRGRVYGNCPLPQPAICARRSSTRV